MPEDDRREVEKASDDLLESVLPTIADIGADDNTNIVSKLSGLASQAFLSELEAERLEFNAEGWTREGAYKVDAVEVLDFSDAENGASATVRACIDTSGLTVRRTDGTVIEPGGSSTRAWNLFVLEQSKNSAWRIVGRTFSDDPAC
ncbi:hypothetical protein CW368_09225 [Actinomycetales bacterium SN12]|nr:hypothetical protein CW368_09225 [Actinomycetales bacterium SN12]